MTISDASDVLVRNDTLKIDPLKIDLSMSRLLDFDCSFRYLGDLPSHSAWRIPGIVALLTCCILSWYMLRGKV